MTRDEFEHDSPEGSPAIRALHRKFIIIDALDNFAYISKRLEKDFIKALIESFNHMWAFICWLDLLVYQALFIAPPTHEIHRDLADFDATNAGFQEVHPGDVHHVIAEDALAKIIDVDVDAARDLRLVLIRDKVAEYAQRVDQDQRIGEHGDEGAEVGAVHRAAIVVHLDLIAKPIEFEKVLFKLIVRWRHVK